MKLSKGKIGKDLQNFYKIYKKDQKIFFFYVTRQINTNVFNSN